MWKSLLFIIAFCGVSQIMHGQVREEQDSRILIRAQTSVKGSEFFIQILPRTDSTKIIFKIKKYLRQAEADADSNTLSYKKSLRSIKNYVPGNDSVINYLNKLDSISTGYTVYDSDSLIMKNAAIENYLKVLKEVFSTTDLVPENKNRFALDGTNIKFDLFYNHEHRIVYARSPTLASHPLLYKLISMSTNLYRENKKNDFLNKGRTSGY